LQASFDRVERIKGEIDGEAGDSACLENVGQNCLAVVWRGRTNDK
jgi:hypothetical protein